MARIVSFICITDDCIRVRIYKCVYVMVSKHSTYVWFILPVPPGCISDQKLSLCFAASYDLAPPRCCRFVQTEDEYVFLSLESGSACCYKLTTIVRRTGCVKQILSVLLCQWHTSLRGLLFCVCSILSRRSFS